MSVLGGYCLHNAGFAKDHLNLHKNTFSFMLLFEYIDIILVPTSQ